MTNIATEELFSSDNICIWQLCLEDLLRWSYCIAAFMLLILLCGGCATNTLNSYHLEQYGTQAFTFIAIICE